MIVRYAKEFYRFVKHIIQSRQLLFSLIKHDFEKQYLGSYFGFAWAFFEPLVFMLVIWFVFDVGFKSAPVAGGIPFYLWLMSGMIPWFFISNGLSGGTSSVVSNTFLVKKVSFRVSILPLISISSALVIHLFLVLFLIFAFLFSGLKPTIYWLQLPYYLLCSIILVLGLSWLTSSIRVFIKDIDNIIAVLLQIGFWATPVFWSLKSIPHKYQLIIKLNPAYYIIGGYRDTFINQIWFFDKPHLTIYFLSVAFIFLLLGAIVFKRLRPHFGDVL